MPWKEIGAILLFLTVIVIFGNLWFSFIEAILKKVKALFTCHREPPAWHPLPPDQEERREEP